MGIVGMSFMAMLVVVIMWVSKSGYLKIKKPDATQLQPAVTSGFLAKLFLDSRASSNFMELFQYSWYGWVTSDAARQKHLISMRGLIPLDPDFTAPVFEPVSSE